MRNEDRVRLRWPSKIAVREITRIERELGEEKMFFGEVGVPHLCVIVADVQTVDVQRRGQALRFCPVLGASGANVNFVSVDCGSIISLSVLPRGGKEYQKLIDSNFSISQSILPSQAEVAEFLEAPEDQPRRRRVGDGNSFEGSDSPCNERSIRCKSTPFTGRQN